jgi:hypothetical protein
MNNIEISEVKKQQSREAFEKHFGIPVDARNGDTYHGDWTHLRWDGWQAALKFAEGLEASLREKGLDVTVTRKETSSQPSTAPALVTFTDGYEGPQFSDGHDWEGFSGGCIRCGCGPNCSEKNPGGDKGPLPAPSEEADNRAETDYVPEAGGWQKRIPHVSAPPAEEWVPLDESDKIIGTWVRSPDSERLRLVSDVVGDRVILYDFCTGSSEVSFQTLMNRGFTFLRPGQSWQPCKKLKTSTRAQH